MKIRKLKADETELLKDFLYEAIFVPEGGARPDRSIIERPELSLYVDDFGSGESSLNMLTKIPVDVLKFDRDFLLSSTTETGMLESKAAKFIEILINLSKHLEKQTVFEGVETQAQRDFLRSIECDQAQGYFYSKPLSEQDFVQFIKLHS